jgi:hypothetical protein
MIELTDELLQYREWARNFWNIYLLHRVRSEGYDLIDQFKILSSHVLDILLSKCNYISVDRTPSIDSPNYIRIHAICSDVIGTPILINRVKDCKHGYWDHSLTRIINGLENLQFIDLYDFDLQSFRDMKFYLVFIREYKNDPNIAGHWALIEPQYVRAELVK